MLLILHELVFPGHHHIYELLTPGAVLRPRYVPEGIVEPLVAVHDGAFIGVFKESKPPQTETRHALVIGREKIVVDKCVSPAYGAVPEQQKGVKPGALLSLVLHDFLGAC